MSKKAEKGMASYLCRSIYCNIIDLGELNKPSYVNGVSLKLFFGRKSIVNNSNDDSVGTTKNTTIYFYLMYYLMYYLIYYLMYYLM
jgi:hypothetical protein